MNYLLRSRSVYLPNRGLTPASLRIRAGKIAEILSYDVVPLETEKHLDYGDWYVTPGVVDTHAHINEPGRTEWEGFHSATLAAASGGITTIIDMPLNSIPATTSLAALQTKRSSAKAQCFIDYGFWGGVIPGNSAQLEPMVQAGIFGFKCFLCPSGVDEFPHVNVTDLEIAMPILTKCNVPLLIHAEIEHGVPPSHHSAQEYYSYLESRPDDFELNAIRQMIELAKKFKTRVHIVHLSTAKALKMIAEAKAAGVSITVETCPHYLLLEAEKVSRGATHFKCAPPIRRQENRDALWTGIQEKQIDFVVSDHSPCTPALKLLEQGNFQNAWGGISGLQFSMSAVWTELTARGGTVSQLVQLMCENTADFLGKGASKGRLQLNGDADIVVWNPQEEFQVTQEIVRHRHKICPYSGMKLKGVVKSTFVRGQIAFDAGSNHRLDIQPHGQEIKREKK